MLTTMEYADGLRKIADWYDQHPDAFTPHTSAVSIFTANTKSHVAAMARALAEGGEVHKSTSRGLFIIGRRFGALTLEFVANQKRVCTSRVVGTRMNPGWPAREPYEEEILEWDCGPLLNAKDEQE